MPAPNQYWSNRSFTSQIYILMKSGLSELCPLQTHCDSWCEGFPEKAALRMRPLMFQVITSLWPCSSRWLMWEANREQLSRCVSTPSGSWPRARPWPRSGSCTTQVFLTRSHCRGCGNVRWRPAASKAILWEPPKIEQLVRASETAWANGGKQGGKRRRRCRTICSSFWLRNKMI